MNKCSLILLTFILLSLSGCGKTENSSVNQNAISKVANGYKIAMPEKVARNVEEKQNIVLTLRHPENGNSSVQGRLVRVSDGLIVETRDNLSIPSDVTNFSIVGHDLNTPADNCILPEFGIGCFFQLPCASTEVCLPGDGPGGFVCVCS